MDEQEKSESSGAVEFVHREIMVRFTLRGRGDVQAESRTLTVTMDSMMQARIEAFERFERMCQVVQEEGCMGENSEYSETPYMEMEMEYSACNDAEPSLQVGISIAGGECVDAESWAEVLGSLVCAVEPKFTEALRRQGVRMR